MSIHCNAKKEDIKKVVLMPGDPLRAKYIAENFLENPRLVNTVRNMLAYTGSYKGTEITVFSSGMGMPSIGIYCYELYKFYDVDTIIRIGSCGSYDDSLNMFDTILVDKSYTEGNFAYGFDNKDCHIANSNEDINSIIETTAKELNLDYIKCNSLCSEAFDPYIESVPTLLNRLPKELDLKTSEMEAFALFYIANYLNKKAACLLTVVDCNNEKNVKKEVTSEERQNSLNTMIKLALESAIKINK